MTRETLGPAGRDEGASTAPSVDFDLGEIGRPAATPRLQREPLTDRWRRWRSVSWRTLAAVAAVACLAAAVGWQIGGGRERAQVAAQARARPPVLAWALYDGPDPSSTARSPRGLLQVHVANLGRTEITVTSISSRVAQGNATATLLSHAAVSIPAGGNGAVEVVMAPDCSTTYLDATLLVSLTAPTETGGSVHLDVPASTDPSIGTPYDMSLNQLCNYPTQAIAGQGLSGVFVDPTSSADRATLVLTNRARTGRKISFATVESDGFELVTDPPGTMLLAPGESESILLTIRVTSCKGVGRLSNWADGVSLQVRAQNDSLGTTADGADPAE